MNSSFVLFNRCSFETIGICVNFSQQTCKIQKVIYNDTTVLGWIQEKIKHFGNDRSIDARKSKVNENGLLGLNVNSSDPSLEAVGRAEGAEWFIGLMTGFFLGGKAKDKPWMNVVKTEILTDIFFLVKTNGNRAR